MMESYESVVKGLRYYRDCYRARCEELDRLRAENAELRQRAEKAEAGFLKVAQAAGVVHQADYHNDVAGTVDEVVAGIERLQKRESNAVAAAMLDRWRERRKRCLEGVAPTLAEIQAAMSTWTNEVVAQKDAPHGSAMRRAIDSASEVIGMLWKHSEALREKFDYEMEQRDELHKAYVATRWERDDVLRDFNNARADLARLTAAPSPGLVAAVQALLPECDYVDAIAGRQHEAFIRMRAAMMNVSAELAKLPQEGK
jgi:uncharacterized coiled-coil DUF342 family protein